MTDSPSQHDVLEIAAEVQAALVRLDQEEHPAAAEVPQYYRKKNVGQPPHHGYRFPHQWCSFASIVLAGRIARSFSDPEVVLVRAKEEELARHWWLEYRGLTVDITRGQFAGEDASPAVLADSPWHRQTFHSHRRENVFTRQLQGVAFETICARLACEVQQDSECLSNAARRAFCRSPSRKSHDPPSGSSNS